MDSLSLEGVCRKVCNFCWRPNDESERMVWPVMTVIHKPLQTHMGAERQKVHKWDRTENAGKSIAILRLSSTV